MDLLECNREITPRNNNTSLRNQKLGMVGEAVVSTILDQGNAIVSDVEGDWFNQDGDIIVGNKTYEVKTCNYNVRESGFMISDTEKLYSSDGLFIVESPFEYSKSFRVLFTRDVNGIKEHSKYEPRLLFKPSKFEVTFVVTSKRMLEEMDKYRATDFQPF